MAEPTGAATDLDERFPAIYDELRRLASAVSRQSPVTTLNPTAIVNEAYLKLASSSGFSHTSAVHFKRIAAKVMRQILWDAGRKKLAAKRGQDAVRVPFSDQIAAEGWTLEQIVLLEDLLEKLRAISQRQADVVECRYYGGLTDEEIAQELGVSRPTIERDWKVARAWLNSNLDVG